MCLVKVDRDPSIYAVTILKIALCIAEEVLPEMTYVPDNIRCMIKLAKEMRFEDIDLYTTEDQVRGVITDDPKAYAKLFLHSAKSMAATRFERKNKEEFARRMEIGWNILQKHDPDRDWAGIILEE